MNSFHKQFALVTGGSTGIGFAIAKQFVLRGGSVAILARRPETLAFARAELENHKVHAQQKVLTLQADVTQKADLEKSLRGLVETHGLPDYVFNSAGVAHPACSKTWGTTSPLDDGRELLRHSKRAQAPCAPHAAARIGRDRQHLLRGRFHRGLRLYGLWSLQVRVERFQRRPARG